MLTVDIEINWNAVHAADRALLAGVRRGGTDGVREAVEYARANHPWKSRSGETEKGIRGAYYPSDRGVEGTIESLAAHSSYLEEGTRPHEIRPKHTGQGPPRPGQSRRAADDIGTHRVALRWFDEGGDVHFARVVHHPGTPELPFIGPAVQKFERVVEREVDVACLLAERILNH